MKVGDVAPGGRLHRRVVEVDTLAEFDSVAARSTAMEGWRVRHVDLTGRTTVLLGLAPAGALLLGCPLEPEARAHLEAGGALVYPDVPGTPIDEYRATLYSPAELYRGLTTGGYAATPDAAIYAWSQRPAGPTELVARALHDASIADALDVELGRLAGAAAGRVVGVMGGHAADRGSRGFHTAATLGRALARRGAVVATGGGPGAMEAANLGAYLRAASDAELAEAEAVLAAVPSFRPSVEAWARAATAVRDRWPAGGPSVGVATWFYGHEPPNLFASAVAKFFQNAVREAHLLNRCTGGVIFLPGAAGTVQEVFQDACENYYAGAPFVTPMVLVGIRHWTEQVPAWPLLAALADAGGFAPAVHLVDDVAAAVERVAPAAS